MARSPMPRILAWARFTQYSPERLWPVQYGQRWTSVIDSRRAVGAHVPHLHPRGWPYRQSSLMLRTSSDCGGSLAV
jgi:hypothetical protein